MPKIEIRDADFHYQQAGLGPDVVLIHAVTANLSVWVFSGLYDQIARKHRVTAYDLRGHGHSAATSSGYTSAAMADDFAAIHRALGLGPSVLVGHSFGGVVAMHAALAYPELVRGVIVSDSFFPGLRHIEPNFDKANVWTDLRGSFGRCGIELGERIDFERLFQAVAELRPEDLERLKGEMGPGSVRWLSQLPRLSRTSCGKEVLEPAGLDERALRSIACPVVLLYDEHSPFQATSRFLEGALRDCRVETVPDARHVAVLQNSRAFGELVMKHLERIHAGGSG